MVYRHGETAEIAKIPAAAAGVKFLRALLLRERLKDKLGLPIFQYRGEKE